MCTKLQATAIVQNMNLFPYSCSGDTPTGGTSYSQNISRNTNINLSLLGCERGSTTAGRTSYEESRPRPNNNDDDEQEQNHKLTLHRMKNTVFSHLFYLQLLELISGTCRTAGNISMKFLQGHLPSQPLCVLSVFAELCSSHHTDCILVNLQPFLMDRRPSQ